MAEETKVKTASTANKDEQPVNGKVKKLTLLNVIAAMFTSIFLIDSIVPAAAAGSSTVIWYAIIGIAFYIPYGLITAEFSSKIPDEGGVYAWVKTTLGVGTAKRVSWYYWVNVGIWAPSIALYISQLMVFMWFPALLDSPAAYNWITVILAIMFMWASLAFSYFPISENAVLFNAATIGKVVIVGFLFLGAIVWLAEGNETQTDFGKIPEEFGSVGVWIMFMPALVYNILGLEAIAGEAANIENPKKNMARATIITTLLLLVFYIITTLAVQVLFDTANGLDLTGIMVALITAFGANGMGYALVNLLGMIFIFTMFIETMGWVSGANAGISESADNEEVPAVFSWTNKNGMPFKSTILLGIIGTVELLTFTGIQQMVAPDVAGGGDLFWSLFAASSNILFLSYFIMFAAYIKAKLTGQLDGYEGYSNNKFLGLIMAFLAATVLGITWFLLLWAPGYDIMTQTLPIVISVVVAMLVGEVCFIIAKKKYGNKNSKKGTTAKVEKQ